MPRWRFYFSGRKLRAIGLSQPCVAERDGETLDEASLKLYDEYEHISFIGGKTQLLPDEKEPTDGKG